MQVNYLMHLMDLKTNESEAIFNDGTIAVAVLDKSSTWVLNRLCKELGDLGLLIYFKAAKDMEESRAWKGKLKLVRTTSQGDELVAIFNPKINGRGGNYESAMDVFQAELSKRIAKYIGSLGFTGPLYHKLHGFTMDKILAQTNESRYILYGKEYTSLDQLMSACEIQGSINKMRSDENKRIIQTLSKLAPSAELGIPNINDIPLKGDTSEIMDFFISIRFRVDPKTWEALIEFTGENGKGVSSAVKTILSQVLNLTGHAVMDYIKNRLTH